MNTPLNHLQRRLLNQNGETLIQVIVAVGILAILALAVANVMGGMWRDNVSLQTKGSERAFVDTIRQKLATSPLCMSNLTNKTGFSPTAVARDLEIQIDNAATPTIAKKDAVLANWNLKVDKLEVIDVTKAITLPDDTVYAGEIRFKTTGTVGSQMSYKEKSLGTLFMKIPNGGTTITDCYSVETGESTIASACALMGGTMVGASCSMSDMINKAACQAVNGTFDDTTKKCTVPSPNITKGLLAASGTCPAGQYVNGFTSSGTISCAILPAPGTTTGTPGAIQKPVTSCVYTYDSCGKFGGQKQTTCCAAGKSSSCSGVGSSISSCGQRNDTMGSRSTYLCICS